MRRNTKNRLKKRWESKAVVLDLITLLIQLSKLRILTGVLASAETRALGSGCGLTKQRSPIEFVVNCALVFFCAGGEGEEAGGRCRVGPRWRSCGAC